MSPMAEERLDYGYEIMDINLYKTRRYYGIGGKFITGTYQRGTTTKDIFSI